MIPRASAETYSNTHVDTSEYSLFSRICATLGELTEWMLASKTDGWHLMLVLLEISFC